MKILTGKNAVMSIKVDVTWYPVLCAISVRFWFKHEEVLITDRNAGKYRKRMSRLMDWGFDVSGLTKINDTDGQKGFFYLAQASIRGTSQHMRIRYTDDDGNIKDIFGDVLIMEGDLSSLVGGFSMAQLSFPGTGEPDLGTSSGGTPVNEFWLYLDTTEGAFEVSHADLGGATAVSMVSREDGIYKEVGAAPSGRQFVFTDLTTSGKLTFDSTLPFNAGEVVYVRFYKP